MIDKYILRFIIACTLISGLLFVYYSRPVDVLKNWKLVVPSDMTYHPGQVVSVHSEVDKLRSAKPIAHRNIECKNPTTFTSYHLADVEGVNSKAGHISSTIDFKIPEIIPHLPTTCVFSISVDYKVNPFKITNEYVRSNEFRLAP